MRRTKFIHALPVIVSLLACSETEQRPNKADPTTSASGMAIANESIKNHQFLQCMYEDDYFPKRFVGKGKQILIRLSEQIEKQKPTDEASLYVLTRTATQEFNELAQEIEEAGSEIETAARECIASDFYFVAKT